MAGGEHTREGSFQSRVALVKGDSRYDNIAQALALIEGDIDLNDKKRILIKPNFVSTRRQLAATHVEAMRAVLDFLRERYSGTITIGDDKWSRRYCSMDRLKARSFHRGETICQRGRPCRIPSRATATSATWTWPRNTTLSSLT